MGEELQVISQLGTWVIGRAVLWRRRRDSRYSLREISLTQIARDCVAKQRDHKDATGTLVENEGTDIACVGKYIDQNQSMLVRVRSRIKKGLEGEHVWMEDREVNVLG